MIPSKEAQDNELLSSGSCPVTGLPILRKPEWTDVSFGKDYRVTVSIVGDSILLVQPSGYITLPNQINVLKLTEQAPAEAISGGRPYIHIEDWSNFQGASIAARKHYMEEMETRKRISGVIFCNVSTMFMMSIKLGKALRMVKFPVHIVDDYSEALRLALEIQSREDVLEDKPVIAPSYEKKLPIDTFPPDKESVCPVTSLPITTRPEWTDIPIDDNYSVSFRLIGNAILCTVLNGIISKTGSQKLLAERERILIEADLVDRKYTEIVDYSMYEGYPSKEIRMTFTNFLLKEADTGNLLGFWVFNPPLFIKWMFTVGMKMYKTPVPAGIVRDYKEAVENAVNVLDKSGVDVGVRQYKRFTKDEWGFELDHYGVRFEMIGDDIIYNIAHGSLQEAHVAKFFDLYEKVLEETGLKAKGYYYRILNWENLEKSTWNARKMYIDAIRDLNRKIPCKFSVIFGLNKFMATIIGFSKQFVPVPITTAHNIEEAVAIIKREKKKVTGTGIAKNKKKPEGTFPDEERAQYCNELLQFMGAINWDRKGTPWEDISESHPFKPVFDALSIIKEDVDDLFQGLKQAEESLRESESKYRDIFENVSDFIYVHDLEGNLIETNLVWKRRLGLTEDDLACLNVKDLIPERYKHQFHDYLNRVKANGEDEGLMGLMTKGGDERIVEYRNSLIHGSTGPIGVRGSARDITEQIRAQSALRQSEKKYRTILENIEDGYFEVDLSGKFTFFNDALCRITGYPKDELMGIKNREYMDEETAKKVYKTYVRIYQTGEPVKGLEYAIRKGGNEKYVEASVSLMKDKKGQPIGFRGILRDVSERKQAEKKIRQYSEKLEEMVEERTEDLRKSEEQYRTILENIEDGYYEVDLAGNLSFFNDSVCEITGYSEDDLMGMNYSEYTDEKNARKLYREYNRVYETGIPRKTLEWELVKKDATKRFMETSISLRTGSEDQPVGFRGILRDVTERKELEYDIIEKSKLAEEASKAKSEFLANMSHEIRTPLNGVIGMVELALDTKLDDNQKNILQTINMEANSLQNVINEILDLSKIEAGKLDLDEIPFDLRYTLEDVANSFAYRAEQKGLDFISFLGPDVQSRLIGDPGRLRQILVNLVGNALKFTKEGEIYIQGEIMEDFGHSLKVRFMVKDTGIGIPKDKQGAIFDSFSQADGSTTRKYGGTGLGTTISKQLAEIMGGELGLESEEGKGSTFWFTAVFAKQKEKNAIPAATNVNLTNLKVLVVDDNQTNRFILTEYLKFWSCLPVAVTGGKEALTVLNKSVASETPFNLILMDFQMPVMSGLDAVKEIKKIETLKRIPIIILSSVGEQGEGKSCRELGINGYLTKPIRQKKLRKAIQFVLDSSMKEEDQGNPQFVTRHSIAEEGQRKFQILLAEDYPTNQQVAMQHLNSVGYRVQLAENGLQAVNAFKENHYDLILMDIQMPTMDGYAATREIRDLETRNSKLENGDTQQQSSIQRVPIIALTAHAMKNYKEKCLDAGMNDYISKPLKRKNLLTIVEKWTGGVDSQSTKAPMDFENAVQEFEGNREILMEIVEEFMGNVKVQIGNIRQAISQGEVDVIMRESHAIKGGALNLTAVPLSGIALELENAGKFGILEGAFEVLEKLENELQRLEAYVEDRR